MNAHRWDLLRVMWVDVCLFFLFFVFLFVCLNAHRWELLRVMWVDVVLAAHCHCQGDVPAVGKLLHPLSLLLSLFNCYIHCYGLYLKTLI